MIRKSKILEEIISIGKLSEKAENIEMLESDVIFIQKINDSAMMIIDERINGYVLHSLESIILLIIFAVIANCNTFTEIYIFGSTLF